MIKFNKTNRGFAIGIFTDRYDVECSIQKSSLATENAIWLGCEDVDPRCFIPGANPPWQKVELPKDTICNTRMHLTQKQVAKLLPVLQHFAETGELIND